MGWRWRLRGSARRKETDMANWKTGYKDWQVDLGEAAGIPEDQLQVSDEELQQAIGQEQCGAKLFKRVVLNRKRAFDRMLEECPGIEGGA